MARQNKLNKIAHEILAGAFKKMLLDGHFPKVQFSKSGYGTSYSLMEYLEYWGKITAIANEKLKIRGFENGLWQRSNGAAYKEAVRLTAAEITPEEIEARTQRLKTMFD